MQVFKTIEKPEFKSLDELRNFKLKDIEPQNVFVYHGNLLRVVMRSDNPRFGIEIANIAARDCINDFELKTCSDLADVREFYYVYRGFINGSDCCDILSVDELNAWLPTRTKEHYYFHFAYPTLGSMKMTDTYHP